MHIDSAPQSINMQIRSPELEISQNDPFQNDALNRKSLAPPLTQFITQASGPFVLAVDGSWGSGKTTFLKMWQVKLTQAGHICLYLNAWKNDFAQDPLIAVVSELSAEIKNCVPSEKDKTSIHQNIEKISKITSSIAKRALPFGLKLATAGILDTQDATSLVEKMTSDFVADIVEDRIKDYEDGKSEIEEFRESLAALVDKVKKIKPDLSAKVVIIIDELDRCRPTYAVQLLERIKHLFEVPGVIFVLGIDRTQLTHSIRSIYGSDFNAQGYLKRFIDLDYRLPEPQPGDYCNYLFKSFGIEDIVLKQQSLDGHRELKYLEFYLGGLMTSANLGLRDQEQIVARLRIILQTIQPNHRVFPVALSLLLFLREWKYSYYESFLSGIIDIEKLLEEFKISLELQQRYHNTFDREDIEAILLLGLEELGFKPVQLVEYHDLCDSPTQADSDSGRRAKKIIDTVNEWRYDAGFKYAKERLELTQNFVMFDD
jgi:hypothetical protein